MADSGLDDKRCIGLKADGQPCGGFKTEDSPYCFRHGPLAPEFEARRCAALRKRADLADKLTNEYQNLQTSEDYVNFIERCINAVLMNVLKKDQITMITQLMSYAQGHIKAMREEGKKGSDLGGLRLTETKTVELTWQTESELDRFLQAGDPRIQVRILEEMQKNKSARALTNSPPVGEIINIETKEPQPEPLPLRLHKWQKRLLPQPGGFSFLENVCQNCGKVSKVASRSEECK